MTVLTLKRTNEKIVHTTSKFTFNNKLFLTFEKLSKDVSTEYTTDTEIKYIVDNVSKIYKILHRIHGFPYLFDIFEIEQKDFFWLKFDESPDLTTKKNIDSVINSTKLKFATIASTTIGSKHVDTIRNFKCQAESINSLYTVFKYLFCFKHLKKNGNLVVAFYNLCYPRHVDTILLGLLLFDDLSIYSGHDVYVLFKNFNPKITQKKLYDILIHNKPFHIDCDSKKRKSILQLFQRHVKKKISILRSIKSRNIEELLSQMYTVFINRLHDTKNEKLYNIFKHNINLSFNASFKKLITSDKIYKIHSAINRGEGGFLRKIIQKNQFAKCLEIGMAFGISSLYITGSFESKHGSLISIDPYQTKQWNKMGVHLLQHENMSKRHTLIQKKSYVALPELLHKFGEQSFDLVFIDGFHTFDYTLVDMFFSDKLLRIGGIMIIDDALHTSVKKCVCYATNNYTHFKKISSPSTVAAYRKNKHDTRSWDFHRHF